MRILLTGAGGAGNEALWRLLGDRYDLYFADADSRNVDPGIPAERKHEVPWASDPGFVTSVADLCRRLHIDVLVPSVDEELTVLSQAVPLLLPTQLMLPSSDYIATMSDKLTMAAALSGKGIAVPATRSMADGPGRMTFPLVAKPRQGRGSRDVVLLRDPESAEGVIARMGERSRTMVLQEWIDGAEYTVQMLADSQGRLHAIAPVKVLQKRGVTIRGETDLEPRVISACRVIHEVIPAAGCYNVQLKLTADGHALPFEINPRISTTFCLTVAAGLDPISIFLRTVAPSTVASCKSGVVLHRHWKNHFSFSDNS